MTRPCPTCGQPLPLPQRIATHGDTSSPAPRFGGIDCDPTMLPPDIGWGGARPEVAPDAAEPVWSPYSDLPLR